MLFKVTFKQQGQIKQQLIFAKDKQKLQQRLQAKKIRILRIELQPIGLQSYSFAIPNQAYVHLFYQFYFLLKSGMNLQEIFCHLHTSTTNPQLKLKILHIKMAINQGKDLSMAFKEAGFSQFICSMFALAQKNGNILQSLQFILRYLKQKQSNQKAIKKALFYPCLVGILMMIVFVSMLFFVLPQFEILFLELDTKLPPITQSLLNLKAFLLDYGLACLCALAGSLLLIKSKKIQLSKRVGSWILQIPLIGKCIYFYHASQFFLVFYSLYVQATPIEEILNCAKDSISNAYMTQGIEEIISKIKSGMNLQEAFASAQIWDDFSIQLLTSAKEGESLKEVLEIIVQFHQQELQETSQFFISLLEPLMIIMLSIFILWLALGIFLPLWELPMQVH